MHDIMLAIDNADPMLLVTALAFTAWVCWAWVRLGERRDGTD